MQFGFVFKTLLTITSVKLITLSKVVGYDTSYLSRFSNGKLLPKGRQTPIFFNQLATFFEKQIIDHQLLEIVRAQLSLDVDESNLKDSLIQLFNDSYQESLATQNKDVVVSHNSFILTIDQLAYFLLQRANESLLVHAHKKLVLTIFDQLKISHITKTLTIFADRTLANMVKNGGNYQFIPIDINHENSYVIVDDKELIILNFFENRQCFVGSIIELSVAHKSILHASLPTY